MRCLLWLSISFLLSACGALPPRHPALLDAALPELLPVRAFVANTDYQGGYQISPDGRKLAWMGVHGLGPAIFVKTLGQDDVRALKLYSPDFRWAGDSRHLLLRKDRQGDENYHVWRVDSEADGDAPIDLTPFERTRAEINALDPAGEFALIAHNRRDPRLFDLYRIDLKTGASALLAENPGNVAAWIADPEAGLRARVLYRGEEQWLEILDGGSWRRIYAWTVTDTVEVLSVVPGRGLAWLRSNRGRDKVALVSVATADGAETVWRTDPDVDIAEVGISQLTGEPTYTLAHPDYPRLEIFDPILGAGLEAWRRQAMSPSAPFLGIELLSADRRQDKLVVSAYDHAGKRYFLWDRPSGSATSLGGDPLARHGEALAPIRPIAFESRDGLTLHGYLTLPRGVKPERLPLVLLVHGGPFARNLWADPDFAADARRVQFLANRGYAVLQVNYRGSTGYGRKFFEAAVGEFGGRMQDDLLDAVAWSIRAGYADPGHIAIMGASYGGYATLTALTRTPGTFACGVDIFGPSDLVSLLEDFPPYWQSALPTWHRFVGNPSLPEERRRLADRSPLPKASELERPLLVIQGTGDVRSAVDQSERMVAALRAAGKPVEYMRIAGMGHGSWHWPHNLRMYRRMEDFLNRCLGGRRGGFDYFELAAWAL